MKPAALRCAQAWATVLLPLPLTPAMSRGYRCAPTALPRRRAQQLLRAGNDQSLGAPRCNLGFPHFKGVATPEAAIVGKVTRVTVGQRQQKRRALAQPVAQVAINQRTDLAGN